MEFKKLGEIADILISNVDKKTKENEYPVKLCNFVDVYYNWAISSYHYQNLMNATATKQEIDKFSIREGDVAITKDSETRDDIGVSTYISESLENTLLGYHCVLIRPNKNVILGKYLNIVLHSSYAQKYFEANAGGSGQRYTLKDTIIKDMLIPIPSIEEQEQLGNLANSIDKKIENNNKINAELESLAKTIYDYWFLQFEFPNEEGKPYKSSGGKMVWNEELKREIPEGWASENFGKLFSSQAGFAFKSTDWVEKGFPVLTIKSIQNNCQVDMSQASFISSFEDKLLKYRVTNGNLIFAMSGNTIGKIGVIASRESNIFINQRVLIIKTTSENLAYIYFLFNDNAIQNNIRQNGANSAQPNISEDNLRSIKICIPQDKILNKYNKLCKNFFDKIIKNNIENRELSSLRDFLLPLLMNGQVGYIENE